MRGAGKNAAAISEIALDAIKRSVGYSMSSAPSMDKARLQRGADRTAVMATLIMTAKLNELDPQAWPADVFARIADTP
ncbi:hypothetical protein GRB70_40690 [Bradyrhizobium neotropicale]|nr:hypothetical protein [Bradyrhizobium neotropicale]